MLSWLISLIPFVGSLIDPISKITNKIIDLKIQQANAQTEQLRIQAQEDIAVLTAQRDVMVAEAQYNARTNNIIRIGFVIPVAVYIWKLIIWDKVIGSWPNYSTDDLSTNLWWIVLTVIGFYFVQNIARIIRK